MEGEFTNLTKEELRHLVDILSDCVDIDKEMKKILRYEQSIGKPCLVCGGIARKLGISPDSEQQETIETEKEVVSETRQSY